MKSAFGGRRCAGRKGRGTVGWSGYSVKGETWPGPMELRLLGVRGFANIKANMRKVLLNAGLL